MYLYGDSDCWKLTHFGIFEDYNWNLMWKIVYGWYCCSCDRILDVTDKMRSIEQRWDSYGSSQALYIIIMQQGMRRTVWLVDDGSQIGEGVFCAIISAIFSCVCVCVCVHVCGCVHAVSVSPISEKSLLIIFSSLRKMLYDLI
jgi:hypothetical protein